MLEVNHLIGFGAGGDSAPTDWRIFIATRALSTYLTHVQELQFRNAAGGVSMSVGGVAYAIDEAQPAANGFDGSLSTIWQSNLGSDVWLAYSHPVGFDAVEVYVAHKDSGVGGAQITSGSIQYKDASGVWITVKSFGVLSSAATISIP